MKTILARNFWRRRTRRRLFSALRCLLPLLLFYVRPVYDSVGGREAEATQEAKLQPESGGAPAAPPTLRKNRRRVGLIQSRVAGDFKLFRRRTHTPHRKEDGGQLQGALGVRRETKESLQKAERRQKGNLLRTAAGKRGATMLPLVSKMKARDNNWNPGGFRCTTLQAFTYIPFIKPTNSANFTGSMCLQSAHSSSWKGGAQEPYRRLK